MTILVKCLQRGHLQIPSHTIVYSNLQTKLQPYAYFWSLFPCNTFLNWSHATSNTPYKPNPNNLLHCLNTFCSPSPSSSPISSSSSSSSSSPSFPFWVPFYYFTPSLPCSSSCSPVPFYRYGASAVASAASSSALRASILAAFACYSIKSLYLSFATDQSTATTRPSRVCAHCKT